MISLRPRRFRRVRRADTFRDPGREATFRRDGFAVVDVLTEAEAATLLEAHRRLPHRVHGDSPFAEGFHTTIYDDRPDYRRDVREVLTSHLDAAVDRLLVDHEIFFASVSVKLAGGAPVPPHLDWTFLDECRWSSVNLLVALEPMQERDGAIGVYVGSHRDHDDRVVRAVNHRSVENHTDRLRNRPLRVVPLRPGQGIVIDNRTVHCSAANESERDRPMVATVVAPRAADLHHYWVDDEGALQRYVVTPEFYLHYRPGERPADVPGVVAVDVRADAVLV